jgi:dsRNA-specific ribonuclease
VLGLASRAALMVARPSADEGGMTRLNNRLVSGASNARYASWLGLERYLLLDPKGLRWVGGWAGWAGD